jgi:4'-phosphopantetheinyl transferase
VSSARRWPASPLPDGSGPFVIRAFRIAPGVWLSVASLEGREKVPPAAQSLAARILLKDLLKTAAPVASGAAVICSPTGAPELAGHPEVRVSLSHDGPLVAAAVGLHRAVGVDVQVPVPGSADRLGPHCLGRHLPLVRQSSADERDEELAWVWTVQEACVKAQGRGLAARPWTLDIPPFQASGRLGDLTWRSFRGMLAVPLSCAYGEPEGPAGKKEEPFRIK